MRHIRSTTTPSPHGFTLVELMVVIVIISILSALTLSGLAGARQRAKIDKTKSTIRKIHEIVMPQYESYLTRRLPNSIYTSGTNAIQRATDRLRAIRTVTLYEMPDSWNDVALSGTSPLLLSGTIPAYAFTGLPASYGAFRWSIRTTLTDDYPSSECLYMATSRFSGNAMENFRTDEIGDFDKDRAPEFADGWGRPIAFIRWPTGFVYPYSPIQSNLPADSHDPFDPFGIEKQATALTPLIYSAGVDGDGTDGYGLVTLAGRASWGDLSQIFSVTHNGQKPGHPKTANPDDYRDNITNHDLISKR